MKIRVGCDYLLIRGKNSFLLAATAQEKFTLFIETKDKELCQTVRKGDLIVVSAPKGGEVRHAGMLLELIRTYHQPLVVLPKGHPCTKRLGMVVSAGPEILLICDISRGTHPEQNVICSSDELSGISLSACEEGILIDADENCVFEYSVVVQNSIF